MHESIKYYFKLQVRRFSRKASEYELPIPILLIIIGLAFVAASAFLFYKTVYAQWIYITLPFFIIQFFKNEHLHGIFTKRQSLILNVIVNVLISLPFIGFLMYKNAWLPIFILVPTVILLAFIPLRNNVNFKLPTPFRSSPFEFIVGFRKTVLLVLLSYFLVFKGIQVGNDNLAFAALAFLFLMSMSFYFNPEDEYFAWIFNKTPRQFLLSKMGIALKCTSILTILPSIALFIFIPNLWYIVLVIIIVGNLYLWTTILAKYAAFPNEMNLPQTIILIISFVFPPMLLFTIPAFYKKAIQRLNPILEC